MLAMMLEGLVGRLECAVRLADDDTSAHPIAAEGSQLTPA